MCNIRTKTDKDKVTIYKWVIKRGNIYFSPIFEAVIKVGSTKDIQVGCKYHQPGDRLYNSLMSSMNLVSGFETKKSAKDCSFEDAFCLLEIVLSGDIYKGTANGVEMETLDPNKVITYAGNFIVSIKEVISND